MALVKCPECGREVSDSAKTCPNCGYKLKGIVDKKVMKFVCIIAALFFAIIAIKAVISFTVSPIKSSYTKEDISTCKVAINIADKYLDGTFDKDEALERISSCYTSDVWLDRRISDIKSSITSGRDSSVKKDRDRLADKIGYKD